MWTSGGALSSTFNAFFSNSTRADTAIAHPSHLLGQDPMLVDYSPDGDCSNDALMPTLASPLLDAGDPALLDASGGRSDIGAFGGSQVIDLDGDGDPADTDCDDWNPDIYHGAIDLWPGDGIAQNCIADVTLAEAIAKRRPPRVHHHPWSWHDACHRLPDRPVSPSRAPGVDAPSFGRTTARPPPCCRPDTP